MGRGGGEIWAGTGERTTPPPTAPSTPPLAVELNTGDALYALLSTHLPCLAFLSRRLTRTRHTIADAFLCVLPPAPTPLLRNSGCPGKPEPEPEMSGTRNVEYPKCRVLFILNKFRVEDFKTRNFKNPKNPTRNFRVARTPRPDSPTRSTTEHGWIIKEIIYILNCHPKIGAEAAGTIRTYMYLYMTL